MQRRISMKAYEIADYYEKGSLGSFGTALMDLFGKADSENKVRLAISFPNHYEAYNLWFYKTDGWNKPPKGDTDG